MWWEVAARAFWPTFAWGVGGVAAFGLGLGEVVPDWVAAVWLGVLALLLVGGLWRLWRLRLPGRGAARARVDARLPGRPLSALRDGLALGQGDGGAAGLWRAHLAQMREAARAARAVPAAPGLARRDPLGLRLAALTALAMAMLFGSAGQLGQGLGAVASTFRPVMRDAPGGPGWEGWAQPPDYTRRPVIYLNALPEEAVLSLPKGSRLSFRLYDDAQVVQDIGPLADAAPEAPVILAERSGAVAVADRRFTVDVLPDDPPVIRAGAAPQRRADGRLVQQFTAADDIGVAGAEAEITLDLPAVTRRYGLSAEPEPREPVRLDLPLPPRGARTEIEGALTADLAQHPWANLPVTIRLSAEDGIGQMGMAPQMAMVLPGRRFFDPLAAALIELRRDLLWSRQNAPHSAQLLRAVSWQPQDAMDRDLAAILGGIVGRLEAAPLTPEARDEVAAALWEAAVLLEDGGLADALAAMQRAQERLSEAMRQGATPDEIARLMEELKRATEDYTRMLAERGETDPNERFVKQGPSQRITGDQIQAMMDEIERLMNEGRMAEAEALLEQFARMMENLQVTQGQGGEGEGGAREELADTLREQQQLADEAMRQMQDEFLGRRPGQQPGEQGEGQGQGQGAGQQGEGDLAGRQRGLREDLGAQRGMLPGAGSEDGEAARRELDRAGEAMREAEEALRQGDNAGAMDRQAEAIEAMREGLRALGRMRGEGEGEAQAGDPGQPQDGPPGSTAEEGAAAMPYLPRPPTDPLGRELSGSGSTVTTGDPLAETGVDPAERARDLLDEIRRRSGERSRSAEERGYLDRLLDHF
ncbi:DUF4175 family protein [Paracoccus sp. S-4012]|nr:DUF4175 family protein [Paracoccus sp. S-4012]